MRTSRIATLGLNPSRIEFEVKGVELDGAQRRFETTRSLGISSLVEAPAEAVGAIFRRCNEYFLGNPYRRWFNRLEPILKSVGASYYDGGVCHLDLSQWATDPTWNGLTAAVRARLVRLLRSAALRLGGHAYEPDRAYLNESTGPKNGFAKIFAERVTAKNAGACERVLRAWTSAWFEVADQAGIEWRGEPYAPGDFENALCIYQEKKH